MNGAVKVIEKPSAGFERETDYRFEVFTKWSPRLHGRRVALYGSGANARRILETVNLGFKVAAVVDDEAIGKPLGCCTVIGLEDALAIGIEAIVIAAEFRSALEVYKRIGEICQYRDVQLFDMYGNEMGSLRERIGAVAGRRVNGQLSVIDSCDALVVDLVVISTTVGKESDLPVSECIRNRGPLDHSILRVIEYEIARGKPVVFYSQDSAVTGCSARGILASLGLEGGYSIALLSETGLWPENGLFRAIYQAFPERRAVHIGSDFYADCLIPLSYGMDSVLVGDWCLPDSLLYGGKNEGCISGSWYTDDSMLSCGPSAERLKACVASSMPAVRERVGEKASQIASIAAPLVIGFVSWFAEELASSTRSFDKVLFASRDGFIIKKVFDIYRNCLPEACLPPSAYFYTSRVSSQSASAGNLAYFSSCGLGLGKTYAFVEFVGAGTCPKQLEAFVPFSLVGFYFGSRIGDHLTSCTDASVYFDWNDRSFLARYLCLEPFLSSYEPSLTGFTENGSPVFARELRSAEELAILRDVHEGVEMLAQEYFSRWHVPGDVVDHAFINSIMPALDWCDTDTMKLYDDLSGREITKDPFENSRRDEERAAREAQGRTSRTVQDVLLGLLEAFDTVCTTFGLTYIATHGTLLGALRHGGFVPWDDDLDIAMPRADYDKFLELADMGVFPEPFFLQTPENDPECFFGGYAKLRDSSTSAIEPGYEDRSFNQGIWMDILPLDNCPSNNAALVRRKKMVTLWQRALYAKTYGIHHIWGADPYKLSAFYAVGDRLSRETLCKNLRNACSSAGPSGILMIFAGNYVARSKAVWFDADDVMAAVRVQFADRTIPVPRNAEAWLSRYYGDGWRTVPEHFPDRSKHQVAFDPNRSFRDILANPSE